MKNIKYLEQGTVYLPLFLTLFLLLLIIQDPYYEQGLFYLYVLSSLTYVAVSNQYYIWN